MAQTGPEHNEVGILLPLPVVSLFLERSPDKQETPQRCKFRGRVRTRCPAIRISGPEILAHFHGISCLYERSFNENRWLALLRRSAGRSATHYKGTRPQGLTGCGIVDGRGLVGGCPRCWN
ncbi:hypothetical protein K0M31_013834 [Melipona bicolor]|uniref:Uncharacterized protein n=1 Tax=Melipona bicolor TaxID=60889 RepID=A0AA40KTU1_9HYME|nr:hypothetical protein K0M31_013834 [Melipona bicolor]